MFQDCPYLIEGESLHNLSKIRKGGLFHLKTKKYFIVFYFYFKRGNITLFTLIV